MRRDLHKYAVHAVETGEQPWAREVALALERACANARAYARTVRSAERPGVLQLQAIAFTHNVIGLDQTLSLRHGDSALARSIRAVSIETPQTAPTLGQRNPRQRPERGSRNPSAAGLA